MKKYFIILILFILNIFLYTNKAKMSSAQIDLDLEKDELALSIFSLDNSKSILINKSDLLILEYIDSLSLQKNLDLYGINVLDNIILNNQDITDIKSYNKQTLNNKIKLGSIDIIKNDNIKIINYYDYSFCVYKSGKNKQLNNCDFIYFLDMDKVDFTDDVLVVFFDSSIDEDKIENYYDKWVDSYILNDKIIYTLKLLPNDYDVIEVPLN